MRSQVSDPKVIQLVYLLVAGTLQASAYFMMPGEALYNITDVYDDETNNIVDQAAISRAEARQKIDDEVIPVLKKYEPDLKGLQTEMIAMVEKFDQSYLPDWTDSLQTDLKDVDVTVNGATTDKIVGNWGKDRQRVISIKQKFREAHETATAERELEIKNMKKKVQDLIFQVKTEVEPQIYDLNKEKTAYQEQIKDSTDTFKEKAFGIVDQSSENGTRRIADNLDLQQSAWTSYTGLYGGEMTRMTEILSDNTTNVQVGESLQQSIHETNRIRPIQKKFVAKLRSLLVLLGTLIFFILTMLLLAALLVGCLWHMISKKMAEYHRRHPKRFRAAQGPERGYHWSRNRC